MAYIAKLTIIKKILMTVILSVVYEQQYLQTLFNPME